MQEDEPQPEPKKAAEPAEPSEEEEGEIAEEGEVQAPLPQVCDSFSCKIARDPHSWVSCLVPPSLGLQALQHLTDASAAALVCGTCSIVLIRRAWLLCLCSGHLCSQMQSGTTAAVVGYGLEARHNAQAALLNWCSESEGSNLACT